jgi:hypothetical protein
MLTLPYDGHAQQIAVSPDGEWVVCGWAGTKRDCHVTVWRQSGVCRTVTVPATDDVLSVAITRNCRFGAAVFHGRDVDNCSVVFNISGLNNEMIEIRRIAKVVDAATVLRMDSNFIDPTAIQRDSLCIPSISGTRDCISEGGGTYRLAICSTNSRPILGQVSQGFIQCLCPASAIFCRRLFLKTCSTSILLPRHGPESHSARRVVAAGFDDGSVSIMIFQVRVN